MRRGGRSGIEAIPFTGKISSATILIGGDIMRACATARTFITGTIMAREEVGSGDTMVNLVNGGDMVDVGDMANLGNIGKIQDEA
jgi:hypothetical protein